MKTTITLLTATVVMASTVSGQRIIAGGFEPRGLGCTRSNNAIYELFEP